MKVEILDCDLSTLVEHLEVRGLKVDTLLMDHIHKLNYRLKDGNKNSNTVAKRMFDIRDFDGKVDLMD